MKNYSIVRIGDGYVVQADEKSVLKVASRRRAAKLVTRAAELWGRHRLRNCLGDAQPSHRPPVIPRSSLIPGIIPDPGIILVFPKFLDGSSRFPYAPRRDTSPQREAYYLEG